MLPTLRTDSAHRALTSAIAVGPLGLLGGLVFYTGVVALFHDDVDGPLETPAGTLLALAVPVMVLSMAAAAVAGREDDSNRVGNRAFAATIVAACACPTVTWSAFILVGAIASGPPSQLAALGGIVIIAVAGAMVGFFAGLPFAVIYSLLLTEMSIARQRAGYAHEPAVWLVVSAAWIGADALAAPFHDAWRIPGLCVAGAGLARGVVALTRLLVLLRWLSRVRRAEVPGYRVIANDPTASEELPRAVPFFARGGVLVRLHAGAEGPFRSRDAEERLARC